MRNSGIVQALIGACLITGMAGCTQSVTPTSAPAQGNTRFRVQDAPEAAQSNQAATSESTTDEATTNEQGKEELRDQFLSSEARIADWSNQRFIDARVAPGIIGGNMPAVPFRSSRDTLAQLALIRRDVSDARVNAPIAPINGRNEIIVEGLVAIPPFTDSGTVLVTRPSAQAEEETTTAKAEDEKATPKTEDEKATPKAEDEKATPKAEEEKTTPKAEDEKATPKAEDEKATPKAEEEDSRNVTIKVMDGAFTPSVQVVHPGQTVTWQFESVRPNTTTSTGSPLGNPRWGSPALRSGLSYRQLFVYPGAYPYRSITSPLMTGVILVY